MSLTDRLDPEIAAVIGLIPFDRMDAETAAMVRAIDFSTLAPPLSDAVERTDHIVTGDPDVVVRVHRPKDAEGLLPCLYSMHGGGYVIGSYVMDDHAFDDRCPRFGMVGVSVEYRLAPETPYPGPLDDCYRGLAWIHEHAHELGIDTTRIGIGGVSAGGGLAASLALLARDRGELPVAFQVLEMPMLDDRQLTWSSQQDGLPVWSRESNRFGWQSYLGDLYGTDEIPHTAAPARATDLSNLPPAFVSVGALDGFLDEDVNYALRLVQAGVPCELHVYPGAPHGYMIAADSVVARKSRRDVDEWLARQFG